MIVSLFKKINFRQNTAIVTQPMRTHGLAQAQDPGSYTQLNNHECHLQANRARQESVVHLHGSQAQFCYNADLFFVWSLFLSIIVHKELYSSNKQKNTHKISIKMWKISKTNEIDIANKWVMCAENVFIFLFSFPSHYKILFSFFWFIIATCVK